MFQLDSLACSKILAQRFAFSMGWKMWHNEFVWPECAPGTEGMISPGLKQGDEMLPGMPFHQSTNAFSKDRICDVDRHSV